MKKSKQPPFNTCFEHMRPNMGSVLLSSYVSRVQIRAGQLNTCFKNLFLNFQDILQRTSSTISFGGWCGCDSTA